MDERNLSPRIEMINQSEGIRDFRRRVAPYQHVDLLESERNCKRAELPVATASPLGRSAGGGERRKRLEKVWNEVQHLKEKVVEEEDVIHII